MIGKIILWLIVALGVVFFIYESRPNVTVDAAGLCVKSGNAIILRGGKEAFHKLVATADVLVENFRPGVMQRLGLAYETLAGRPPFVVPQTPFVARFLGLNVMEATVMNTGDSPPAEFASETAGAHYARVALPDPRLCLPEAHRDRVVSQDE